MQIELIGCTSSGKSSLIKRIICNNPNRGENLITSYDFVLQWAHLDWIKNHSLRMAFLNILAIFACLFTWQKNVKFYRFILRVIWRLPNRISFFEKIKISRIIARNIGIYEIVRTHNPEQQIILADEGTLQIAHYLFVHTSVEPNLDELAEFVRLVSMPDYVVYVREPEPVLIARTEARGHKRIPANSPAMVMRFIQHGRIVFDNLTECAGIDSRVLLVNSSEFIVPISESETNTPLDIARKTIAIGLTQQSEITI